jgi:hypothetical protein
MTPSRILARGLLGLGIAAAAPVALAAGGNLDLRVLHHEALRDLTVDAAGRPVSFEAYGRRFEFALERNDRLRFVTPTRLPGVEALRGELRGLPRSWVRVTRTPAGLYGMFSDGLDVYAIEPAHELAAHQVGPAAAQGLAPVVYRLADTLMPVDGAGCGTPDRGHAVPAAATGQQQFEAVSAELQAALATGAATPTEQMEIAVTGDYEFSGLSLGGLTPEQAIAARMNVVDGIYSSQVGVKLLVSSVTVFRTPSDPFSSTTVSGTLLDELGDWRRITPAQSGAGLSHLMTGRDLDGTTVGIAYIGALCSPQFGVSLSQAVGLSPTTAALVIAHEIGHNFGAEHDGELDSACATTPQTFLMAPRITGSDQFSQCSLDTIAPEVITASCIVPRRVADAQIELPAPSRQAREVAFDYGFSVRSVGEVQVDGLSVAVTLPPALAFNSGSVAGGSACTPSGSIVNCSLGSLAPGASRNVTVNLTGQQPGNAVAAIGLSASNDLVIGNNSGSVTFVIDAGADLSVALGASPSSFTAGGSSQVTATVRHLGGDAVSDARLAFTIPSGLSVTAVAANALGCALASGSVSCTASALEPSATESVTLTVTGSQVGTRQIGASVSATTADPVTSNNSTQVSVEVRAASTGGSSSGGGGGGGSGSLGGAALLALLLAHLVRRSPRRLRRMQ